MNAIHELDLMRFVLSAEAIRIYAEGGNLVKESISMEDTSHVMIRLTDNSICSIEATTAAKGFEERIDFEILGSNGSIRVADSGYTANSFSLFTDKKDSGFESGRWTEVPVQQTIRQAFTSQAQHMIDCILKDKTPLVTGEDARKTLELTLAAYRSMETHRSVALDTRA